MTTNKYTYLWVVQSYTGSQYGWEDECASESRGEAAANLLDYRQNSTMPSRLIHRRELNAAEVSQ